MNIIFNFRYLLKMLQQVISGGQTGADLAGLIAAKQCGLPTGGTAPKKFKTEDGTNSDLQTLYHLVDEGSYKSRSIKNVCNSHGTIAFLIHHGSGGTAKTIGYCKFGKWTNHYESDDSGFRPVLVINSSDMASSNLGWTINIILKWLRDHEISILNVAGHRQSTAFQPPFYTKPPYDYQQRVTDILIGVFTRIVCDHVDNTK